LYQVQYRAPGDPALAQRVQRMLAPMPVSLDNSWASITAHGLVRRRRVRGDN
jgi:aromatic ring-opening dioxygenase catalytic subunit (LigB family)